MIEVSMRCPCGTHAVVDITASPRAATGWSCKCPRCYDGSEDSGTRAHCLGHGPTPESAIASWWEQIEQAWEIDYQPNTLFAELSEQVNEERERTQGWLLRASWLTPESPARWWGPSISQMADRELHWDDIERGVL